MSGLYKKIINIQKNFQRIYNKGHNWLMWGLYNYGIQMSFLYGIYTKPIYLMVAWYYLTGNEKAIQKM